MKLQIINYRSLLLAIFFSSFVFSQSELANQNLAEPLEKDNVMPVVPLGALVLKKKPAYLKHKCGMRKALGGLVSVYEICMNLTGGKASDWENAFGEKATHSFLLTLDFKRGVGGEKVSGAFKESLDKIKSSGPAETQERVKFLKWVESLAVNKKDVFDLFFNDEGKAFVMLYEKAESSKKEGETFESTNRDFAKSVAKIWLGPTTISEEIKNNLLKD